MNYIVTILISIFALTISIITCIRVFFLDKEYCEFHIEKGEAQGLGPHTFEQKKGYVSTFLRPTLHVLKTKMYELNFTEENKVFMWQKMYPDERTSYMQKEEGDTLSFYYTGNNPRKILISFLDSKNNYYTQELLIIPFYNRGTPELSTPWSISLTKRKWHFGKSIKRKYFS